MISFQETVVRGIKKIRLWRQGTDLRAWLFTILHNLHISGIRRAVCNGATVDWTYVQPSLACAPPQIEWLTLHDLERALARLPEQQRSVVVLVGVHGELYEAIAARLGIPVGTVRSRLSRGRTRLRELIESPHRVRATAKRGLERPLDFKSAA